MMLKRQPEPFLWLLFSGGGMASALVLPAVLFLFGIAFPLGWLEPPSHESLLALVRHPITRIVLLGLVTLSMLHWAHRFRYTLYDGLQIKHLNEVINALCYGGAAIVSIAAAYLLWRI
jgi:fumarate reductase subunit D